MSAWGPIPGLLDEVKDRHEKLQEQGLPDAEAHNQAQEDVDYDDRYRSYINELSDAQEAIQ